MATTKGWTVLDYDDGDCDDNAFADLSVEQQVPATMEKKDTEWPSPDAPMRPRRNAPLFPVFFL